MERRFTGGIELGRPEVFPYPDFGLMAAVKGGSQAHCPDSAYSDRSSPIRTLASRTIFERPCRDAAPA